MGSMRDAGAPRRTQSPRAISVPTTATARARIASPACAARAHATRRPRADGQGRELRRRSTCAYPKLADGTSCDDDDACTSGDKCETVNARRQGEGVLARGRLPHRVVRAKTGDCESKQVKDGTECDDGLKCTANEQCKDGVCKDSDASSACLEGATDCSESNGRTCTCDCAVYASMNLSHLSTGSVCDDAVRPARDVHHARRRRTCTCDNGWAGDPDSRTVARVRPARCRQRPVRVRSERRVRAAHQVDDAWAASPGYKSSGGAVPTYSWAIRKQVYSSDGTLQTTTIPCGGSRRPVRRLDLPEPGVGRLRRLSQWGTMNNPGAFQTSSSTASIPNALAASRSSRRSKHPVGHPHGASADRCVACEREQRRRAYSAANPNKPYWVDDDHGRSARRRVVFIPPQRYDPITAAHRRRARGRGATGIGPDNTCGAGYTWEYPPDSARRRRPAPR